MAHHRLDFWEATLHDNWSSSIAPTLTIDSGDTVAVRTLDVAWGTSLAADRSSAAPTYPKPAAATHGGPPLCGPIFVRGAQPGDVLEVYVEDVVPGSWGWTRAGGRRDAWLDSKLRVAGEPRQLFKWSIDNLAGTARSQFGHTVRLSPFMGMIGVCPPGDGVHDAWAPTPWGQNLDCKELTKGAVLYLPVAVPGALFSTGDGHATQGDGELAGAAIECPMDRVQLKFVVNKSMRLSRLRARTADAWVTFGFSESLNDALIDAANDMLDLITEQFACAERSDALALATSAVDFRVTQVANPKFGVHAMLPHAAITT